ncbi:MAG: cell division protein FtsI (penicillin-binding protein 3) [Anaerolineaceae bacterium]|nr:MAG: cell division protein FtsI (penicillin-binding protein 3) [Anaerolineaceae bacterium]
MKTDLFWRFRAVQIALILSGLAIIVQIIHIQNSPEAQAILDEGERYTGSWQTIYPARGEIYDRNGRLLAGNRTVYEAGVDLTSVKNVSEIATAAQLYLGLDYATVYNQITNPESPDVVYVVLDKYAAPEDVLVFQEFQKTISGNSAKNLSAVYFQPHMVRSYPERTLGSNVIGLITIDGGKRSFGVEEKYDSLLSGTAERRWIPSNPHDAREMPAIPSSTALILTIDREVQSAIENILDNSIQVYGARSGVIIVADPQTGEILGMASTPRIDPNQYWNYNDMVLGGIPYNRGVSQAYEPGSVLKILTMAAALDKGVVHPGTIYPDLTGEIIVGGFAIRNWDNAAWGNQDMTGCLQHSLNVCLAWVAAVQLGQDDFYAYMQQFGLGHLTGVDLAGEDPGRLKLPDDDDWYEVDLGTNAYGQGVSVTPLQMIVAASAIANNGQMPRPHVLKATVQNGRQDELPIEIIGTPISANTAQTLTQMLATSLENESSLALVPGYRLAGKTGTASIPTDDGYTLARTNVSFIGWGPVDDPQFIVYIWLEQPTASIWGSETAAPVFKQVVERLIVLMGIPPDQIRLSLSGQ